MLTALRRGLIAASALFIAAACSSGGPTSESADDSGTLVRYTVTFQATWRPATHRADFPPSPHFSGLIGGTHGTSATFWSVGGIASDGIRNMAELGSKSPLEAEVRSAINAGRAGTVLSGGGISPSPGSASLEFEISPAFPLVTLVSMVAPSPDWFVGVSGLDLRPNGAWLDEVTVQLFPYDAGTDGGTTYLSADQVTSPRQPIARIQGYPFAVSGAVAPLGTFTFRRRTN